MSKLTCNSNTLLVSGDKVHAFFIEGNGCIEQIIDYRSVINTKEQKNETPLVDCIEFSPCGELVAMCIYKELFLYHMKNKNFTTSCEIEKTASCVKFFNKSKVILIADRSGCAWFYSYDTGSLKRESTCFGHNSMLTDALISENDDFIITSDRDEKIRVSHYPNVYNIQSYCLGHDQFVSSLSFLPSDPSILLSASGDGTIRLWDFIYGKEVMIYKDNNQNDIVPLVKIVSKHDMTGNCIAVQKYRASEILLISITGNKSLGFHANVKASISTSSEVIDMCLSLSTFVCLVDGEEILLDILGSQNDSQVTNTFIKSASKSLSNILLYRDGTKFKMLFKREFDNVQEYHAKKKLRLSEKRQ